MKSALHESLIDRILAANPGTERDGFWSALVENVVAESRDDITCGHYTDRIPDAYALTKKAFRRQYLQAVSSFIRERVYSCPLPDAFSFPPQAMSVVVWEVSCANSMRKSVEKWIDLNWEIDSYDPWRIEVITVDSRGIASFNNHHVDDDKRRMWTWQVDESCPVVWGATDDDRTDRKKLGGTASALEKRLARVRLTHDFMVDDDLLEATGE